MSSVGEKFKRNICTTDESITPISVIASLSRIDKDTKRADNAW